MNPLVSVLINNFNYGSFVGAAIDSVLAQTYGNMEVIVVDDGSHDESRQVIAKYGNQIRAIFKENGGQASAFNAGFLASSGDLVCLLDADDLFLPTKISRIVEVFNSHPEVGWCFDAVTEFDDKSGERFPRVADKLGEWDVRQQLAAGVTPFIPTATSGMSFRRDTLVRILPMPEVIRITSDGYVKLVALALVKGWMASEELTLQRIHGNNAYTKRQKEKRPLVGRTGLLTGLSLHEKFPSLQRLSTTLFSRGLGMCWVSGGLDPECQHFAKSFFAKLGFRRKLEVYLRAAYWTARHVLANP